MTLIQIFIMYIVRYVAFKFPWQKTSQISRVKKLAALVSGRLQPKLTFYGRPDRPPALSTDTIFSKLGLPVEPV